MLEWVVGAGAVGLMSYEQVRLIKRKKKYQMTYRYIRILQHEDNISVLEKIKHMITVFHEFRRTWPEQRKKGREWFRFLIHKNSENQILFYLGFPEDRINGIKTTLKNTYPLIEMHDFPHSELPFEGVKKDKNIESGYFDLQKKGDMSGLALKGFSGGDGLEDILLSMEAEQTEVFLDILFTPERQYKLKRSIAVTSKKLMEQKKNQVSGPKSDIVNSLDEFGREFKQALINSNVQTKSQIKKSERKLSTKDFDPDEMARINAMKKRYTGRETAYKMEIRLMVQGQYASAVAQTIAANVRAQFQLDNGLQFVRSRLIGKKIMEKVPYNPGHTFLVAGDELNNLVRLPDAKHRVMEYVPHLKRGQRTLDIDELREGISIGKLIHPILKDRLVRIAHRQMNKHFLLTGKTGSGKSSVLMEMLQSLLEDWQSNKNAPGFTFVDPARDTVATILNRMRQLEAEGKKIDWDRVHYFDLADPDYSLGLNLLYSKPGEMPDDIVERALNMITRTYGGLNAPQMERVIRNCLTTLVLDTEQHVILGIIPLLRDERFRSRVLARITEPTIMEFWKYEFPHLEEKLDAVISPILNRLSSFSTNIIMRRLFGQPEWNLQIREWMDKGHIVLFSVRGVREQVLSLAGEHIVNQYHAEFQGRSTSALAHYFLFDEAHRTPFPIIEKMIAEDRKFGLALGFSTQFPEQLPTSLYKAFKEVSGNVLTTTLGSDSAAIVSKATAGKFNPQYLQELPERVIAVYTAVDKGGKSEQTTFTVESPPPFLYNPDGSGKWADHLDQEEMRKALEWGLERGRELQARDSTLGTKADEIIHQYLRPGTPLQVSSKNESIEITEKDSKDSDSKLDRDELYEQAVQIVISSGQASVSLLQRNLRVGYTRAARLMDSMEENNVVGPYEANQPRKVLSTEEEPVKRRGYLGLSFFEEKSESEAENHTEELIAEEETPFDLLYEQAYELVIQRETITKDMFMQELGIDELMAQTLMNAMEQQEIIGADQEGKREVFALPGVPVNKSNLNRWM